MSKLWSYVNEHGTKLRRDGPNGQRAGRVLRVKDGYNPNSSSIGTAIPSYLVFAAASGAVTLLLLNLESAVGSLLRKKGRKPPTEAETPEPDDHDGGLQS